MHSTTTTSVRAGIDAVMQMIRDETARQGLRVLAEIDVADHLSDQNADRNADHGDDHGDDHEDDRSPVRRIYTNADPQHDHGDGHRLLAVADAAHTVHALVADPFSAAWLPRWVSVRRVADVVRVDAFGPVPDGTPHVAGDASCALGALHREVSARMAEVLDEVTRRLAA
ncbi:hypothetical protein [Jatrophihabitans fulvus]